MRRQPKDRTLKDRETLVINNRIHDLKKELSRRYESDADRLLGYGKPIDSDSPATISGGRPESNRRKF
jgi:hypothetical protein